MNTVYIATSLDGYIAKANGDVDWLHEYPIPDDDDLGFSVFMQRTDALVMGRNTFETVHAMGVWPYDCKVFVLTTSLKQIPADMQGKIELIAGTPAEVVRSLNKEGFESLYIDGGKVIQAFLADDLIDELIITRVPILLGGGIPLFDKLDAPLRFSHKQTEIHANVYVKSHYVRRR